MVTYGKVSSGILLSLKKSDMASKKPSDRGCTESRTGYNYRVMNVAAHNTRILARIEAIYAEIDKGTKCYTKAELGEMRREIAALRSELK
jgi:hypothetical protein